jgi:SAM-dependent methyltransferase
MDNVLAWPEKERYEFSAMDKELVQELTERYTREAEAYRDLWAPILLPLAKRGLDRIETQPVRRALEIGTGVGTFLPALHSAYSGAFVLGVDRSAGMLALATTPGPLAIMDAMQLALASQSFDLAFMNFVLFHLMDPLAGLVEAKRVLKPRGRLVTVTWGSDLESPATKAWDEALDFHGAPPLDAERTATRHDLVDSPEKMESLLKCAGFASAQAWQEPCQFMIEADHLIRLRTTLGRARRRYENLDPKRRDSCLSRAREHLSSLPPENFLAKGTIIYAMGY